MYVFKKHKTIVSLPGQMAIPLDTMAGMTLLLTQFIAMQISRSVCIMHHAMRMSIGTAIQGPNLARDGIKIPVMERTSNICTVVKFQKESSST